MLVGLAARRVKGCEMRHHVQHRDLYHAALEHLEPQDPSLPDDGGPKLASNTVNGSVIGS